MPDMAIIIIQNDWINGLKAEKEKAKNKAKKARSC